MKHAPTMMSRMAIALIAVKKLNANTPSEKMVSAMIAVTRKSQVTKMSRRRSSILDRQIIDEMTLTIRNGEFDIRVEISGTIDHGGISYAGYREDQTTVEDLCVCAYSPLMPKDCDIKERQKYFIDLTDLFPRELQNRFKERLLEDYNNDSHGEY